MTNDLIGLNEQKGYLTKFPDHITKEQVAQLKNVIKGYYIAKKGERAIRLTGEYCLLIDLLWNTGCRISDITALQVKNINVAKRVIDVYIKKSKLNLELPIEAELAVDLNNYIISNSLQVENKLLKMTRFNAWCMLKRFGKQIGMQKLHPHLFRHGLAVHLIKQGVHPRIIQGMLAHSDIRITMGVYGKITTENIRDAIEGKR